MVPAALWLLPVLVGNAPSGVLWGREGHHLVCEIAWQRLTPAARALVRTVRAADPDSGSSFPASCLWADRVRSTTHPHTYYYHFINIPAGAAGADLARDCGNPDRRCAPWAIRHYAAALLDPATSLLTRAEALKFLAHFVGDLHQPLHAGRPEDLGGNRILVDFFGTRTRNGDSLNLHGIWDSAILERAGLTWPDSVAALNAAITPTELAAWDNLNVVEWANESYRIAEDVGYRLPPGKRIDQAYYDRAVAASRQRIKQGGARLALLLNRIAAGTLDLVSMGIP